MTTEISSNRLLSLVVPNANLYLFDGDKEQAWDRLDQETPLAYQAFVVFRDLGRARTIRAAYEKFQAENPRHKRRGREDTENAQTAPYLGKNGFPKGWGEYSRLNAWRDRAEAYDDFLELQARERRLQQQDVEIDEYRSRARQIAIAKTNLGAKLLTLADGLLAQMRARDLAAAEPAAQEGPLVPTTLDEYRTLSSIIRNASVITDSGLDNEAAMVGVTRLQAILDEQERAENNK